MRANLSGFGSLRLISPPANDSSAKAGSDGKSGEAGLNDSPKDSDSPKDDHGSLVHVIPGIATMSPTTSSHKFFDDGARLVVCGRLIDSDDSKTNDSNDQQKESADQSRRIDAIDESFESLLTPIDRVSPSLEPKTVESTFDPIRIDVAALEPVEVAELTPVVGSVSTDDADQEDEKLCLRRNLAKDAASYEQLRRDRE